MSNVNDTLLLLSRFERAVARMAGLNADYCEREEIEDAEDAVDFLRAALIVAIKGAK